MIVEVHPATLDDLAEVARVFREASLSNADDRPKLPEFLAVVAGELGTGIRLRRDITASGGDPDEVGEVVLDG